MSGAVPPAPRPIGAGGVLLIALVHLCGFVLLFGLVAGVVERPEALMVNAAVAAVVAPLLALYVGLTRHAPDAPLRVAAGLAPLTGRGWAALGLGLVLGVALAPLLATLGAWLFEVWPLPELDEAKASAAAAGAEAIGAVHVGIVLVAIAVVAPVIEELLYRGLLLGRLAVRGWRGAVIVAVAYGAVQLNLRFTPGAVVLGLALALTVWAARSTWASIAAHVGHRLAPLVLGLVGLVPDGVGADAMPPVPVQVGAAVVAVGAAVGLWLVGRRGAGGASGAGGAR